MPTSKLCLEDNQEPWPIVSSTLTRSIWQYQLKYESESRNTLDLKALRYSLQHLDFTFFLSFFFKWDNGNEVI